MTDKQILKAATGFRKGILGKGPSYGMCFAVSAPLEGLLNLHGVEAKLTQIMRGRGKGNHCFLTLPDGRVLDPTADQFNSFTNEHLPPVYLGDPKEIHKAL